MTNIDKIRSAFLEMYSKPDNVVETDSGYRATDYTDPFSVGFVENFGKFKIGYMKGQKDLIEEIGDPVASLCTFELHEDGCNVTRTDTWVEYPPKQIHDSSYHTTNRYKFLYIVPNGKRTMK